MRRIFAAFLVAAVLVLFSACGAAPATAQDSIAGTWKDSYGLTEYSFYTDGTMKIEALNHLGSFKGTYAIEGDRIAIDYRVVVKEVKETYTFRIDGNTLYLNDKKFQRKD